MPTNSGLIDPRGIKYIWANSIYIPVSLFLTLKIEMQGMFSPLYTIFLPYIIKGYLGLAPVTPILPRPRCPPQAGIVLCSLSMDLLIVERCIARILASSSWIDSMMSWRRNSATRGS